MLLEGTSKETDLLWEGRISTQAPEIDGVCHINDFGPASRVIGRAPHRFESPKRTITIWSVNLLMEPNRTGGAFRRQPIRSSFCPPLPFRIVPGGAAIVRPGPLMVLGVFVSEEAKRTVKCPICKKDVSHRRSQHALLQRSLPYH